MLKDDSNDTEARDSSTIRDIKSQELSNKCTSNVAIIVGTKSIYDLQNIADKMEVWAPNLPEYKLAAEGIRETVTDTSITLFNAATSESPEQEFLSWLPTVDLHHGEYSSDTPWEVIYVYGASITSEITQALKEYGVEEITATDFGFLASRTNSDSATQIHESVRKT